MGKNFKIPIEPGGMFSDVVEKDGKAYQHQKIKNMRIGKKGLWESVQGYKELFSHGSYTDITAAIEIDDEYSDDRFMLFQNGTELYRIDYNDGSGNGYENETPHQDSTTLPSGVTIGASATLRFFHFRGVVRITGASVPLWYSYIDREIFDGSYGTGDIVIAEWVLVKAALEINIDVLRDRDLAWYKAGSTVRLVLVKQFLIYDESQYTLKDSFNYGGQDDLLFDYIPGREYDWIGMRITIDELVSAFPNKRITGVGICVAVQEDQLIYDDDVLVWYVTDVLPLTDEFSTIIYKASHLRYEAATPNAFFIKKNGSDAYNLNDILLQEGDVVSLSNVNGDVVDATITSYSGTGYRRFQTDKSMAAITTAGGGSDEDPLPETTLKIVRKWYYNTNKYERKIAVDLTSLGANEYHGFVDIPAGTNDISPNYSHHVVIEDRPYVASLENEEEDVVRFGPLFQFDTFPNVNIIQTQVGDTDFNKAIVKRSNRLVMLKGKSFSQGNYVGAQYYEDIGIKKKGLFPNLYGFIVIDDDLFFMDKDDVHIWNGAQLLPFLKATGIKKLYRNNVDTSSFMIYDKFFNELWLILSGIILVFQFDNGQWYLRETDITPLGYYLDTNNDLIVFSANKFGIFNHTDDIFSETIGIEIITKVWDLDTPEFYKAGKRAIVTGQGDPTLKITTNDFGVGG